MDTISTYDAFITDSHISPFKYPKQISRIKLSQPALIHGFIFHMEGNGFGTFKVDIYGSEGGAQVPYFQQQLCPSHYGLKNGPGLKTIEVKLDFPVYVEGSQFFVSLSGIQSDYGLLRDSTRVDELCFAEIGGNFSPTIVVNHKDKKSRVKSAGIFEIIMEPIPPRPNLFEETTEELGLPIDLPDHSIAVADVDKNGWQDLLIGNQLFFNENGKFYHQQISPIDLQEVRKSCFIDMDLDGDEDLLFFGVENTKLWVNEGDRRFSERILNLPSLRWLRAFSIADVNGDGYLDLFCAQLWDEYPCPQTNYLFINDGNLDFLDETKKIYPAYEGGSNFPRFRKCKPDKPGTHLPNENQNRRSRACSFADYDMDGDQDLYVANYYLEEDEFYENDGKGNFSQLKAPKPDGQGTNVHNHSTGVCWVDYDNDLDFDLFVPALAHPPYMLGNDHRGGVLYENIDGIFQDQSLMDGILYEETQAGSKFGDFNNDGFIDFISTAYYECRYASLYVSDSTHTFTLATNYSGFQNQEILPDLCLFDYNNDGKLDVAMAVNRSFRIFKNISVNDFNWLALDFTIEGNAASPIGSIVKVYAGKKQWMRQINSGAGQAMQEPKRLHFGLGNEARVDSIQVFRGPEDVQSFFNLSSNMIHKLPLKN